MKFIHISDLHLPTKLSLFSLRGKDLIGYLNFWFRRKKLHPIEAIQNIIKFINNTEYDCLIISGDITNIANEKEFIEAKKILSPILNEKTFMIPGNHDRYSHETILLFEKYFEEFLGEKIPVSSDYSRYKTFKDITLLGLDSNEPTSIANASGNIKIKTLEESFDFLKSKNIKNYSIVCHHPIWSNPNQFESEYHKLRNRDEVKSTILKNPPLAYFHGHSHTNWIRKKDSEIPYTIINSASSTRVSDVTHDSGFHTGEINESEIKLKRFIYIKNKNEVEEKNLIEF